MFKTCFSQIRGIHCDDCQIHLDDYDKNVNDDDDDDDDDDNGDDEQELLCNH